MSKRSEIVAAEECIALGASQHRLESYPTREVALGDLTISRALPIRERRLVGPWCFLDRFGPLTFSEGKPMDVAPHPHIGLQTVSWLHEGEVVHDDSLGSASILRPGGVNVMTAGAGIAHAEQTPREHTGRLNGVQLWTALPDEHRTGAPRFIHVAKVPALERPAGIVQVFAGRLEGAGLPGPYYSPLLGADLQVHPRHTLQVPLDPTFEHAMLVMRGDCTLDGEHLAERTLYYLGTTRSERVSRAVRAHAYCSSAVPHFPRPSSCGGISWRGPPQRSHRRAQTGRSDAGSATSRPTTDRDSMRPASCSSRARIPSADRSCLQNPAEKLVNARNTHGEKSRVPPAGGFGDATGALPLLPTVSCARSARWRCRRCR
jgi:redox-sensitive bicupin YhaK (pirin superfamily)